MGDLQVDLNAALVAVKKKCVDLEETVRREDSKPQNRGRGYLGVKRYIYALTTKKNEHSLNRRGRSLTRVYVEQKFYRSKSVPSPDQVHRLEDCTQDYDENGEERLEFTETIDAPLEELIKEDKSHQFIVAQRLPKDHGEWDHELAVYEEDGVTGLLEDRTLMIRAGDHPFGMNQFNEAEMVSAKISAFFGQKREEEGSLLRTRELSLSVQPVYHQDNGDFYTSFGMTNRSKSMGNVYKASQSKPRLGAIENTTNSLSDLYVVQTRHDYDSKYGHYVSGLGRYGHGETLPPPKNPEVLPKMPKEHVYDEPVFNRRDTVIHNVPPVAPAPLPSRDIAHSNTYSTTYERNPAPLDVAHHTSYTSTYERKYDFVKTFPPSVEMPVGYHDYYDPSKLVTYDSYYQGNITRPLHYNYGRGDLEKYSDYFESRRPTPSPVPLVEPEPVPEPVKEPIKEPEPVYIALHRTEDLPTSTVPLTTSTYADYYDNSSRIRLHHTKDLEHQKLEFTTQHPDYYDNAARILLHYTHDIPHETIEVVEFPEYIDQASRYQVLQRTEDIPHDVILIGEYPEYKPYEEQEVLIDFDEEPMYDEPYEQHKDPIYEEIYEPPPPPPPVVLHELQYTKDLKFVRYIPDVPAYPPPPPPPEEVHIATPVVAIPEPEPIPEPIPATRHYDELYIGQEALDVSVSPTFGRTTDQKNLGLEKSVHDRVREMEQTMRGEERKRMEEEEKRRRYEERQNEIREARLLEEQQHSYNAYEEVEERYSQKSSSAPSSPCKIKCDKRKTPNRKNTPAVLPQPIQVPDAFIIPEKPKRTWVPPPKEHIELDEHEDKPLGPVVFHELLYSQGILRHKYEEDHRGTARPVTRPVSRANSRPGTPGPEHRSIDFPRVDGVISPRDHSDSTQNIDYVQKHIERYNAYGASTQDSQENRAHSHVHTVSADAHHHHHHGEHHHHHGEEHQEHHHHHHHNEHHQEHRESVVYDEPSREVVYDIPHDHAHHHHAQHVDTVHYDTVHHHHQKDEEDEQLKLEKHALELQYQLAQTNLAIRQMSKSNKWAESDTVVEKRQHKEAHVPQHVQAHGHSEKHTTTTTSTTTHVLHHSNSLNRQNIPPPLAIHNGNKTSHEDHHVHYSEDVENIRSTSRTEYTPVNVGHVKSLTLKFNKVDEKPISTEQVIYRVRAAPPGHHLEQEVTPAPRRSLPRVPMDEVTLHEHGGRDHLTRQHQDYHQSVVEVNGNHQQQYQKITTIGSGVTVGKGAHHNSHYHQTSDEEPTVRVRRVYKAVEDSSMLSPVSNPANDDDVFNFSTRIVQN